MDNIIEQQNNKPSDKKKVIFKILTVILIAILLILGIIIAYRYFKAKKTGEDMGPLFPITDQIGEIIKDKPKATTTTPTTITETSKFAEIYKGPVGGYIVLRDEKTVRLFDRAKGLIIDVDITTGEQKTITEQPILKVHDVTFIGEESFITRSYEFEIIKSNLYNLERGENDVFKLKAPTLLSDNILELAKSENNKYVVFVIKDSIGGNIDILDAETDEIKRLLSIPLTEWIPSVTNQGEVFLSSKASKFADSGTYKIMKGTLDTVAKAKTAQTSTVSPNGRFALAISVYDNDINPEVIEKINDNYVVTEETPDLFTIADKCSWNSVGTVIICGVPKKTSKNIPDDWYLGLTSYNDNLFKYDVVSKKFDVLFNPETYNQTIDAVSLDISKNNLFFKNKLNEHLFVYRLDEDLDIEKEIEPVKQEEVSNETPTNAEVPLDSVNSEVVTE